MYAARIAELSVPFYYILSVILPAIIVALIYRYISIRKIIRDKLYSLKILSTLITTVASLLYVETHFIIVLAGLKYVPYGIDNIFGAIIFIFSYLLIDSYLKIYQKYYQSDKSVVNLRNCLFASFLLTVFFLLFSSFFLGSWLADLFVAIFGVFSILFFIITFYSINFLIDKLDRNSRINLFWFRYFLICMIIVSITDTIIDILNLPIVLNVFYIPLSILSAYVTWMFMKYVVHIEKFK